MLINRKNIVLFPIFKIILASIIIGGCSGEIITARIWDIKEEQDNISGLTVLKRNESNYKTEKDILEAESKQEIVIKPDVGNNESTKQVSENHKLEQNNSKKQEKKDYQKEFDEKCQNKNIKNKAGHDKTKDSNKVKDCYKIAKHLLYSGIIKQKKERKKFFPEINDDEFRVPWLYERPSIGVAFSGGGMRSAAATLGQLRALHELKWLNKIQYISAISGGSWTALPYTYLKGNTSDETFLGKYQSPNKLITKDFEYTSYGSMASAIEGNPWTWLVKIPINTGMLGDKSYSKVVGDQYLKLFGLNGDHFFSFHSQMVCNIKERNSLLKNEEILTVKDGRPYLVVGGSVGTRDTKTPTHYYPLEMTGLYTGIREPFNTETNEIVNSDSGAFQKNNDNTFGVYLSVKQEIINNEEDSESKKKPSDTLQFKLFPNKKEEYKKINIGGGYVESFGYDSKKPTENMGNAYWKMELSNDGGRFTLSDVIGTSSAALQHQFRYNNITAAGFPEMLHWPVKISEEAWVNADDANNANHLPHADGGTIDNLALMPLLVRKVKNIIVFINSSTPFVGYSKKHTQDLWSYFKKTKFQSFSDPGMIFNHVLFDKKLERIQNAYKRLQSKGMPLVYCDSYLVKDQENQENSKKSDSQKALEGNRYGVDEYPAKICWVYLDRTKSWVNTLGPKDNNDSWDNKIKNEIKNRENGFEVFPHLPTLPVTPYKKQINAMAHLTSWTMMVSSEAIKEYFCGENGSDCPTTNPDRFVDPYVDPQRSGLPNLKLKWDHYKKYSSCIKDLWTENNPVTCNNFDYMLTTGISESGFDR